MTAAAPRERLGIETCNKESECFRITNHAFFRSRATATKCERKREREIGL